MKAITMMITDIAFTDKIAALISDQTTTYYDTIKVITNQDFLIEKTIICRKKGNDCREKKKPMLLVYTLYTQKTTV